MAHTVDQKGALRVSDEAERIRGEAADWFARLSADCANEADYRAYREWRDASTSHAQAYDAIADIWVGIGHHADAPAILEMRVAALAETAHTPSSARRVSQFAAIAASVAVVFAIVALLAVGFGPFNQAQEIRQGQPLASAAPSAARNGSPAGAAQPVASQERALEFRSGYSTKIGQMAQFRLPDGSLIELNTGSQVEVDYSVGFRNLTLVKGEAVFTVSKDANRPFIVAAGSSRVVALGTVFSVRKSDDASEVTLIEGKVRVDRDDGGTGNKSAELAAGERLLIPFNQPFSITKAEPLQVASWRAGRLVFEQTPLRDVIAEFNRYSTNKHVLGDDDIGELRVSGTFRIKSSEHFAATLEAGFPISVLARAGGTVLEVVSALESPSSETPQNN